MKSTVFASLFLSIAAVSAVPIIDGNLATRELQASEVVVVNGNKTEILTEAALHEFYKAEGILMEKPAIDEEWLNFVPEPVNETAAELSARQIRCSPTSSFVIDKEQRFVDWDVQMSPVTLGAGSGILVRVESGWTVSNAVAVSAGIDSKWLKDKLTASFGVSYTRTWTSVTSFSHQTTIAAGFRGVFISQPWTNRKYGRTFQGCPGSMVQTGTFMADSHEEGSYDNARWVSGQITACIKRYGPKQVGTRMTRCNGSGEFR
ncbi:hypothetical protein CT0861_03173 [Colletotrichum tofieldiae]|uniref:Celp0028 effector like protein n=1 Tax=Colletotrichum tofieldiae TaxID=708197 RepID=A0A166RLN9_9PEZI|nr:hypothetical protein CT0861_03173 [Colletotrichum tofieldiae]GKT97521.1 hypothetical protein Ct61P_15371 [Colletotrichum tofieldiae]